jgi:hypothetical protein
MRFTLNLLSENELSIELADKLFENKFDDALLYQKEGLVYLDFDRESIDQTILELEKINVKSKEVK